MSSKGSSGGSKSSSGNNNSSNNSSNSNSSNGAYSSEPQVVSGWRYHQYSRDAYGQQRYVYIGKDDDGEPEFIDYGPKGKK